MPSIASLVLLVVVLAGCAGSPRPAAAARGEAIVNASCAPEPLAHAPLSGESGVYRAGPLTLSIGEDLAQLGSRRLARSSGEEAIALITGDRPVVVRVDPASPARFALQFHPLGPGHPYTAFSDGRAAERFPGCGGFAHRFGGGVLFAGSGCARLEVQPVNRPASSMLIPIGNSLRGCTTARTAAPLPADSLPFLGVACATPDSIACDRVGIGVTTEIPARLVVVQIAGRLAALSPPGPPQATDAWRGSLQAVSLRRGPLAIPIPRRDTLWFGSPELHPQVRVTVFFPNGYVASRTARVLLHPGFG